MSRLPERPRLAPAATPRRRLLLTLGAGGALVLSGCATLVGEPPKVTLSGIDRMEGGEGLEMRLALKLRVQNPNNSPLAYDGLTLALDLNGSEVASGVAPLKGEVPRYGEQVLVVPVTVSALTVLRQLLNLARSDGSKLSALPYRIRGRIGGGMTSAMTGGRSFDSSGTVKLPFGNDAPAGSGTGKSAPNLPS